MSVWQQPATQNTSPLSGVEGDLLSLRVTVEAFLLEDLLELLASAPFPLNPEIRHHATMHTNGGLVPAVHVEFPLWRSQIDALRELLGQARFETELGIAPMLDEIRTC